MLIFAALLIPFLGTLLAFFMFKKEDVRKYILIYGSITTVASLILIFVVTAVTISNAISDTEYHGYYIVRAERYEYWSTWVVRECQEEYTCGTDDKGNDIKCSRPVDCSSCDQNPEVCYAYDNKGNQYNITRDFYYMLLDKWHTREKFV